MKKPCPFCSGEHDDPSDDGCCFCDYTGKVDESDFIHDNAVEQQNGNDFIADHSTTRSKAIKWFKSLPFIKARSLAINETGRFIREPFRELTGREMEKIWSQHCA